MGNYNGYQDLVIAAYNYEDGLRVIEESEYLDERQKYILLAHYRDCKTYRGIGRELGLTGERVRQIEKGSMGAVRTTLMWSYVPYVKREVYEKPVIEYEGMSVRSRNALMRNGLTSAEKVMGFLRENGDVEPEAAFMKMRNVGKESSHEMYLYFARMGLYAPWLETVRNGKESRDKVA